MRGYFLAEYGRVEQVVGWLIPWAWNGIQGLLGPTRAGHKGVSEETEAWRQRQRGQPLLSCG
jgi:hypothetical protein